LPNKAIPPSLLRDPRHLLALGFGSGLAPVAPGTFGTLAAVPLYLLIAGFPLEIYLLIVLAGFLLGVYLCGFTTKVLGVHDHGGIVWDEIVGFWITMIAVAPEWYWMVLGFLLFRLFDIVKPWPIRWVDKHLQGGFGIMFDDVLAGIFAALALHLVLFIV
jgi:phosphatidylglycerophosphatase A